MIEQVLLNYGVLGLWTASLLWKEKTFEKRMIKIIERNTEALNHVSTIVKRCRRKGVR